MSNSPNILDMVVHLSLFVLGRSSSRFTRVDSLENTKTTKVLERDLKSLETSGSTNKGGINTTVVLFANLSHARELALAAHARVCRRLVGLFLGTSLYSITHDDRLLTRSIVTIALGCLGRMTTTTTSLSMLPCVCCLVSFVLPLSGGEKIEWPWKR